jgi:hypothetical protein
MCRGEASLVGYETQYRLAGEQTQQGRSFGAQRSHLHETIRSRFVFKQPAVLDVYVSQPSAQRMSVHGSLPTALLRSQLHGKGTLLTISRFQSWKIGLCWAPFT